MNIENTPVSFHSLSSRIIVLVLIEIGSTSRRMSLRTPVDMALVILIVSHHQVLRVFLQEMTDNVGGVGTSRLFFLQLRMVDGLGRDQLTNIASFPQILLDKMPRPVYQCRPW